MLCHTVSTITRIIVRVQYFFPEVTYDIRISYSVFHVCTYVSKDTFYILNNLKTMTLSVEESTYLACTSLTNLSDRINNTKFKLSEEIILRTDRSGKTLPLVSSSPTTPSYGDVGVGHGVAPQVSSVGLFSGERRGRTGLTLSED